MAIRGDYLVVRVQQHSSGTVNEAIASTRSCSVDFSAEFLETTSQSDALNQTGIAGKVSCTISGEYLLASSGDQFTNLFTHMNAGNTLEVEVYRNATKFLDGDGVLTSLGLSGGDSGTLFTGSYTIQCSGDMATS